VNYWLDLLAGTTWREFRDAGASVPGFSAKRRSVAERIQKGDVLLCYLTGVMRWVGALEVGDRSTDTRRIWKDQEFPVRFHVKPLLMLEAEHGLPMEQLISRPAKRSLTLWPARSPLRLLRGGANQFPGGSCTRWSPAPFTAHCYINNRRSRMLWCCILLDHRLLTQPDGEAYEYVYSIHRGSEADVSSRKT
jgi:hypothetical protein